MFKFVVIESKLRSTFSYPCGFRVYSPRVQNKDYILSYVWKSVITVDFSEDFSHPKSKLLNSQ